MSAKPSEHEYLVRFSARYQNIMAPLSLDIDEKTLGSRRGVLSLSPPHQVETLARATMLQTGESLLDIGSGAGWPGLRIGELTGARVILSDITIEGPWSGIW